jgi:uncharacterized protein YdhG (YjbR/CyaY superfamily)
MHEPMAMNKHKTVPAYLAAAPKDAKAALRQLRAAVRALAPQAEESISYGMPGYKLHGRPLVYYAAFARHVAFFPASGTFLDRFTRELKGYRSGKGTLQFPYGKPLPMALIRKLVKARVTENVAKAGVGAAKKGVRKTCSRGHVFYKSSDCPVCPACWSGYYRKKAQSDFPKGIGAPALRALVDAKIRSLAKLATRTEAEVAALHGMGPKALGALKRAMRARHLSFKKTV